MILWEYFVQFERHISVHKQLFPKYYITYFGLCTFFNNGYLFSYDAVFLGHPVHTVRSKCYINWLFISSNLYRWMHFQLFQSINSYCEGWKHSKCKITSSSDRHIIKCHAECLFQMFDHNGFSTLPFRAECHTYRTFTLENSAEEL